MMHTKLEDFIPFLDRPEDDPELTKFIRSIGASGEPFICDQLKTVPLREVGLSLLFEDRELSREQKALVLDGVHFYSEGKDGYQQYSGQLPNGLRFGDERSEVHRKMGSATKQGGGHVAFGVKWPEWDRYDFPTHCISVNYTPAGRVDLITLMRARYGSE